MKAALLGSSDTDLSAEQGDNTDPEATQKRVAALIRALQDTHVSVVWNALRDLARMEQHALEAVPALQTVLEGHDPTSRLWARVALACITGDMDSYRQQILEDAAGSKVFAGMGLAAVVFLGNRLPEAMPFLLAELRSDNADRRWCAANALGRMGSTAEAAVPQLATLLADPDEKVRWYAAWAIGEIGTGNTTPAEQQAIADALGAALNDFDDDVRGYAALALARMGGHSAARYVSLFSEMQADPNPAIQRAADEALHSLIGSIHDN